MTAPADCSTANSHGFASRFSKILKDLEERLRKHILNLAWPGLFSLDRQKSPAGEGSLDG
jgi:hypothetical protein